MLNVVKYEIVTIDTPFSRMDEAFIFTRVRIKIYVDTNPYLDEDFLDFLRTSNSLFQKERFNCKDGMWILDLMWVITKIKGINKHYCEADVEYKNYLTELINNRTMAMMSMTDDNEKISYLSNILVRVVNSVSN